MMTHREEPELAQADRSKAQRFYRRVAFTGLAVCLVALVFWFVSRSSMNATDEGSHAIEVWTLVIAALSGVGGLLGGVAAIIVALRPASPGQRTRVVYLGSGRRAGGARSRRHRP